MAPLEVNFTLVILHDFVCTGPAPASRHTILFDSVPKALRLIPRFLGKRFLYFHDWLLRNSAVHHAVILDAFDSTVVNDPFWAMHVANDAALFVQTEWSTNGQRPWMQERFKRCLPKWEPYPAPWTQDTALFNCAVLGGKRRSLLALLGPMTSFLHVMQREIGSSSWCFTMGAPDMVAINYVIHRHNMSRNVSIVESTPLVNVFRGAQYMLHSAFPEPRGMVRPSAHCNFAAHSNEPELLPSNWTLQEADAFIMSRWRGPRKRINCSAFPFTIFHNAGFGDVA